MKKLGLLSLLFVLGACTQPTPEVVEVTREIEVTREVPVTEIVKVYVTEIVKVEVVRRVTVIVTPPGPTSTPTITPTTRPTRTPEPTRTPKPTVDVTTQGRGNGFYLVGSEMAPGVWRSKAGVENCYWEITNSQGGIINNHFGMSGGTMYVTASAFQVQLDGCGSWEYLGT